MLARYLWQRHLYCYFSGCQAWPSQSEGCRAEQVSSEVLWLMNANSSLINDREVRPGRLSVSSSGHWSSVWPSLAPRTETWQRYQTRDGTFLAFRYADTFSYQRSVISQWLVIGIILNSNLFVWRRINSKFPWQIIGVQLTERSQQLSVIKNSV